MYELNVIWEMRSVTFRCYGAMCIFSATRKNYSLWQMGIYILNCTQFLHSSEIGLSERKRSAAKDDYGKFLEARILSGFEMAISETTVSADKETACSIFRTLVEL